MRLKVEPDVIALAPGDVTDLLVRVHNDGEDVCTPHLQVRGLDPDDVLLPEEVVAVPAGSVMTAVVRVRAAADAIPGDQRIAVAAEDLDGGQGTVSATTVLRIGARPDVAVEVDPVATAGRRGAKAQTILRNRSDRRLQIDLEGRGEGVRVAFRPSRVTLDPGETKRVRTRMRRAQRSWFGEIRHGAVITARGVGAPASTTATFTQKPSVPRPAVRGVAALTALAVWIAATVVVFNRINAEPEAGPDSGVVAAPAAPGPGRTSATGMFVEEEDEGVRLPVVIQGTIEGPRDLAGTAVTAERIGFGEQGTTSGFTKVVALAEVKLPRGNVLDVVRTTTDERGRFRIASGLVEDAFYRVTAVRAGFEVGSFIVSTSPEEPEVTLAFALEPASGSLAGTVTDASGAPVGGASVLVTDGAVEYTTVTPAEGELAGQWTLEGLATPATYQVIVTRRGFAAQTLIVELDGGQDRTGVDATLVADLGTIVGRVTDASPDPNQPGVAQGVGALTVTLAGPEARETRTLTVDGDLRGTFDFPGLPFGDYQITFAGDGWLTRQAEVRIDDGLVRLDTTIDRSTGLVQGWVWQDATTADAFQGECRYPRASQRDDVSLATFQPCGGVAVTIASDDGDVFATASADGTGFFQIGGVPAGEYTLTLSRAGYFSHVRTIVVRSGRTLDINPERPSTVAVGAAVEGRDFIPLGLAPPPTACVGTVLLTLIDRRDGVGIAPVTDASGDGIVRFVGQGQERVAECEDELEVSRIGSSGTYRIDGLPIALLDIMVGDDAADALELGWAYFQNDVAVEVLAQDPVPVSIDISPRPRELTIPEGFVRLLGPAAATREITLDVIEGSGAIAGSETFTVTGGASNDEVTLEVLTPSRNLRLRVTGGDGSSPAGEFPGFASLGDDGQFTFELPPGLGPFTLPLREVVTASIADEVAILETAEAHGLEAGAEVVIDGVGAPYDGSRTLTQVTATTVAFALPGAVDAAESTLALAGSVRLADESEPLTLTAQTRVSGAVLGISADTASVATLNGATVTIPGLAPITAAGGGAFSAILDSAVFGSVGGPASIEVAATGHEPRLFLPAPGRSLFAPEEVLRPAGAVTFGLYPDLTRAGATAGDVGLDPSTRPVTIDASLLGGTGASRTLRFELQGGTVAGQPVRAADGSLTGTIVTSPVTLSAGAAATAFDLGDVPVGTYTVAAVPNAGDRIALRGVTVAAGGASVTGAGPTFTLVVPPGDGAITLSANVRARTLLSGTVNGFSASPLAVSPLAGATVTIPGSGSGSTDVLAASDTSTSGGSFSVEVDSADYGSGGLGAISIAAAGYDTRTLSGTLADNTSTLPGVSSLFLLYPDLTGGSGEVGLDPTPRDGSIDVTLTAVGGVALTRDVTVQLTGGTIAGQPTRIPGGTVQQTFVATLAGASPGVLTSGTAASFAFEGVPAGDYTLEIGGDHVRTVTAPVTIAPDSEDFELTSRSVVARAQLTLEVEALQPSGGDLALLAKEDASVTFASSLAAAGDRDGDASAPSSTDEEGTLTVWIDAGTHAPDAVTVSATHYDDVTLGGALTATGVTEGVELQPSVRDLAGTLTLEGSGGVTRSVVVELWEGDGGGFTDSAKRLDTRSIPSATVGANPFTFVGVRPIVGGYTLRAVGADPDIFQVTEDDSGRYILEPGAGPDGPTDPLVVTARTRLTLTTTGIQRDGTDESLTPSTAPLAGVAVSVLPGASPDPSAPLTTDSSGEVVVIIDAGDYSTGPLGPIDLTLAGYDAASVTGPLTAVAEARTVALAPSSTEFTGSVTLAGAAGASRDVTVEVCATPDCSGSDPLRTFDVTASTSAPGTFDSSALAAELQTLPVEIYTFRVSGDGVATETFDRVVGPADGKFATTALPAVATVALSGTITEVVDPAEDGAFGFGPQPVPGVTVTASSADHADVVATTGADGTYSMIVPSGTWELGMSRSGYATLTVVSAAYPDDETIDRTLDTSGGFQVIGEVQTEGAAGFTVVAVREDGTETIPGIVTGDSYRIEGIPDAGVWRIDFAVGTLTASRWIDATAEGGRSVRLDQDLRDEALTTLTVVVNGTTEAPLASCADLAVTLAELGPFPTLSADGTAVLTTWVHDADAGSCTGSFQALQQRGTNRSIIVDRFTVDVTEVPDGYEGLDAPLEVIDATLDNGGTVTIDLATPDVEVEVEVENPGTPVTDATVVARRGGVEIGPFAKKAGEDNIYVGQLPPHVGGDPWNIIVTRPGNATRTISKPIAPGVPPAPILQRIPPLVVEIVTSPGTAIFDGNVPVTFKVRDPGGFGGPEPFVMPPLSLALEAVQSGARTQICSLSVAAGAEASADEYEFTIVDCNASSLKGTGITLEAPATLGGAGGQVRAAAPVEIPVTAPGAPTGVNVTPAQTTAFVEWTAPASTGGSAITGYSATIVGSAESCSTSGTTSCTISGLTAGSGYEVVVRATNAVGGTDAAKIAFSTPSTPPPSEPRNLSVTVGDEQLTASWTAPSSGSPILDYEVTLSTGDSVPETSRVTSTSTSFTSLTNGATYSITVRARNDGGFGSASGPVAATPTAPLTSGVGGNGAIMKGTFTLTGGETLQILAGSRGGHSASSCNAGGGGGSFVWRASQQSFGSLNGLLIAAGGGGGSGAGNGGQHASLSQDGTSGNGSGGGTRNIGVAGTGGNGGNAGAAGWLTSGNISKISSGSGTTTVPRSPVDTTSPGQGSVRTGSGAPASPDTGVGGFGGGAAGMGEPCSNFGAGGGGGFSGGASYFGDSSGGGGGGSFILSSATGQSKLGAASGNTGAGQVIITEPGGTVRTFTGGGSGDTNSDTGTIHSYTVPGTGSVTLIIEARGGQGGDRGGRSR